MIKHNIPSEAAETAYSAIAEKAERETLTIATHSGKFHADDVFACALLHMAAKPHGGAVNFVRTRDAEKLAEADVRLDVGGICDFEGLTLDHHIRDFGYVYDVNGETVPMAACGIVWAVVGHNIVSSQKVFDEMADWLFQIDATDVGRADILGESKATSLAGVIATLNSEDINGEGQDQAFAYAVDVACHLVDNKLNAIIAKVDAEEKVLAAACAAQNGVMLLGEGCPWVEAVCDNYDAFDGVNLCVYQSGPDDWRVQTLPANAEDRFSQKCPAPSAWKGLRGDALVEATGVENATFIHPGGFIGGATTREDAVALATAWAKAA